MNTIEIQAALNGHGFPCAVDGVAGAQTTQQIKRFQAAFCGPGGWLDVDGLAGPRTQEALSWTVANNALVSFFSIQEIACKHCGCAYVTREALSELYKLRVAVNRPLAIFNCYRCPVHNKEVGGASNSQHLYGRAFDIPRSAGITIAFVQEHTGFTGIGSPNARSRTGLATHVDLRPGRRIAPFYDASVG